MNVPGCQRVLEGLLQISGGVFSNCKGNCNYNCNYCANDVLSFI